MNGRTLVIFLAVATSSLSFGVVQVGCVGDAPAAGSDVDGSIGSDASNGDGSAAGDSGSADSSSNLDAGLTFDGANAYCNDLFPGSAPQIADVECSDASIIFTPIGGSIAAGHYYLVSQTEPGTGCGTAGSREGIHDAVEITAGDSGAQYIVNAAIDGTNARRLTLVFAVNGAGSFSLAQSCPATDAGGLPVVDYSVTSSGASTELQYFLPGADFGLYEFKTY